MPKALSRSLGLLSLLAAVAATTGAQATPPVRRVAVVVDIGRYTHLGNLNRTKADGDLMASALTDCGWEVVRVRDDSPGLELTRDGMIERLTQICDGLPPLATVLLYYSGHGMQTIRTEGPVDHVCFRSTRADQIEQDGLSLRDIEKVLRRSKDVGPDSRLRTVILFDACRNGGHPDVRASTGPPRETPPLSRPRARSSRRREAPDGVEPEGHVQLLATRSGEAAAELDRVVEFEGHEIRSGLFTHFLERALKDVATDTKPDGRLTTHEIFEYIRESMTRFRKSHAIQQEPDTRTAGSAVILAEALEDQDGPVVRVDGPNEDSPVSPGAVTLRGGVRDPSKVRSVWIHWQQGSKEATIGAPGADGFFVWKADLPLEEGKHEVRVLATDYRDNRAEEITRIIQVAGPRSEIKSREEPTRFVLDPEPARAFDYAGRNAQGFEEFRWRKDPSVIFVAIPGGTFDMGSRDPEGANEPDESPVRAVRVGPFLLSKYEITWKQYHAYCKAFGRPRPSEPDYGIITNHPVVNVSWNEAVAFCTAYGFRLPSEAEWEYAASGSENLKWPWGDEDPESSAMDRDRCNSAGTRDGFAYTSPVGRFPRGAGPFGVLDQAGNVGEWCSDWYAPYAAQRSRTDVAAQSRVVRGGAWGFASKDCRTAWRNGAIPSKFRQNIGFRPAISRP